MSTESDAKIAANNAEIMAAYEKLWEMQQQEMDKARADNEGAMMSSMALHEAGQEADSALSYMLEWQKTVNSRSEAEAQGIPPPEHMVSELIFESEGSNEDRWDVMGDIFNPEDPNGGFTPPGGI